MKIFERSIEFVLALSGLVVACGNGGAGVGTGGATSPTGIAGQNGGDVGGSGGLSGDVGGSSGLSGDIGGSSGLSGNVGGSSGLGGDGSVGGTAGLISTGGSSGGAQSLGGAGPSTSSTRQTARPIGGANTAPNGYYEYLPPGYNGSTATPLLVFWHGIGQDGNGGSDLHSVPSYGPPKLIAEDHWEDARPFIVLSPQYTSKNGDIAPGGGCPSSAIVDAFITWAMSNYKVDAKRVYLTGLSCGAIGSWDYLANKQGAVVAAAVLLSGNPGDPSQPNSVWARAGGCVLGNVAIWSFHGDHDDTVPYGPDHDTMQKLIACPIPPRRATTFTDVIGGSHNIWDPIYGLSAGYGDIYAWMLANAKP